MEARGRGPDCEMQFVFNYCSGADVKSEMENSQPCVNCCNMIDGSGCVSSPKKIECHDPDAEDNFRRKLKFFFMNPCEKFKARGRKPWKLGLQILKIAIITIQLVSFGLSNQMVVAFKEENLMAFKHLFLKGYRPTDKSDDNYAVYTQSDVYDHVSFAVEQFLKLPNVSVGNHAYEWNGTEYTALALCQEFYKKSTISPGNESFDIDPKVETECFEIKPVLRIDDGPMHWKLNLTVDFSRLLSINIYFTLKAINLQTVRHHELPDCYDFHVAITFNNKAHSGRVKISLDNEVAINECKDWDIARSVQKNAPYLLMFDAFIIVSCLISLILCTRSVINGIQLQYEYTTFFLSHYSKPVPWSDRMEFVNGWYILIIVSDVLTIIGSILKIEIQAKNLTSYDVCSILLGTSTMLVWIGVIRYLGFFQKYNLLILTLRAAFPNVIRFWCCASMIYLGYCFCGWIVLGPYHEKFRTFNTVTECLFSLINGDDMFPTFKGMQQKSYLVWLFSRLYLYSFISLFIYMVLSLFIALITDTYETIKQYQRDGFPETELHSFMAACKDLPNSGRYRIKGESRTAIFCCCNRYDESKENLAD
ncbi:mucolipin-3 isoform X1 [Polyodon spathula]|uniref:mucolipin-3 isoform X1 n=2 Tax=Polyodon spathula TaxID=7913 RepID=UPI001B7EF40B|nr:mucolipin-3 isoform X1 [Polyodon spathula]